MGLGQEASDEGLGDGREFVSDDEGAASGCEPDTGATGFTHPDSQLQCEILAAHLEYQGRFFNIEQVELELPDGSMAVHDVLRHPGAVGVIALDDQGCALLVRQYRSALERVVLEIPAGKLEAGEDAEECARRELREETGYAARTWRYLTPIAIAVGYSDEVLHLFLACDLELDEQAAPDADEFVCVERMPLPELVECVLDGRVEDSKTMIAALLMEASLLRSAAS
jgi:ADP-ribose pyrophosphatase